MFRVSILQKHFYTPETTTLAGVKAIKDPKDPKGHQSFPRNWQREFSHNPLALFVFRDLYIMDQSVAMDNPLLVWERSGYKPFPNIQDARHIQFQVNDLNKFIEMVLDFFRVVAEAVEGLPNRSAWIHLIQSRFGKLESRQHRFFIFFTKGTLIQEDYIRVTALFLQAKVYRTMCTAKKDMGLEAGLKHGGYLHLDGVLEDVFVKEYVLPEILGLVKEKHDENDYKALHNTSHQVEQVLLDIRLEGEEYPFLQGIIGKWLQVQWPDHQLHTTLLMRNRPKPVSQWNSCLPHWDHTEQQCHGFKQLRLPSTGPIFVIIPLSHPASLNLHIPFSRRGPPANKVQTVTAVPGDILIVLWDCCHSTGKPRSCDEEDGGLVPPTVALFS